jgi:hypothetical protein
MIGEGSNLFSRACISKVSALRSVIYDVTSRPKSPSAFSSPILIKWDFNGSSVSLDFPLWLNPFLSPSRCFSFSDCISSEFLTFP